LVRRRERILSKDEASLRLDAIVTSRPQASRVWRWTVPTKTVGPPLTPLPARKS